MLCPRCNSENELGEKFCRHCGAPLVDEELFLSDKERKLRKKEKKRQEKLKRKQEQKTYSINVKQGPKKTYSLNEKAYRRDPARMAFSLFKSLIVLVIIIILGYYLGGYILKVVAEKTDHYSAGGTNVASVNYVLGDRPVKKVKYSYDNGIKVEYQFDAVDNKGDDLTKYVSYVMEHNKFLIEGNEFNPSTENGSVKLYVQPTTLNSDKIIMEINWTTNAYSITLYKQKNI